MARQVPIFRAFPYSILPGVSVKASAVFSPMALIALCLRFALSQSRPLTAVWDVSGIDGNGKEEACVCDDEEEKDTVYHKDTNRWAGARSVESGGRSEEVVDC